MHAAHRRSTAGAALGAGPWALQQMTTCMHDTCGRCTAHTAPHHSYEPSWKAGTSGRPCASGSTPGGSVQCGPLPSARVSSGQRASRVAAVALRGHTRNSKRPAAAGIVGSACTGMRETATSYGTWRARAERCCGWLRRQAAHTCVVGCDHNVDVDRGAHAERACDTGGIGRQAGRRLSGRQRMHARLPVAHCCRVSACMRPQADPAPRTHQ
jgi:hypothetical protein